MTATACSFVLHALSMLLSSRTYNYCENMTSKNYVYTKKDDFPRYPQPFVCMTFFFIFQVAHAQRKVHNFVVQVISEV